MRAPRRSAAFAAPAPMRSKNASPSRSPKLWRKGPRQIHERGRRPETAALQFQRNDFRTPDRHAHISSNLRGTVIARLTRITKRSQVLNAIKPLGPYTAVSECNGAAHDPVAHEIILEIILAQPRNRAGAASAIRRSATRPAHERR